MSDKLITKEEADAAEELLESNANPSNYWDENWGGGDLVLVDGKFTISELEAIIVLKRYQLQQQGS